MPDASAKQEVTDEPLHLCRLCGADLVGAARRIGVCAWCVASNKYERIVIPGPRYRTGNGERNTE